MARGRNKETKLLANTLPLHLMLLPAVILLFVFNYLPMLGIVIAFQDFDITWGGLQSFWKSEWVGFGNFARLLKMPEFFRTLRNTFVIATAKIICGTFVPIVVALMLNEVRQGRFKRVVQTLVYIPHFVSWVLFAGIIRQFLMLDGVFNQIIGAVGMEPVSFLQSNEHFVPMLITTDIWKNFGYGTIIYLAAISGIDPNLYEAAVVDGAGRLRQTWNITLPGMRPIIVLTCVLALQRVLNAGFDQIFNLYNTQVYRTADIIDTLSYRISFEQQPPDYSLSTAIGFFRSTVSIFLISTSWYLARKLAGYQIF